MSIECFDLTKKFGVKTALDNVSLEISEGRITGLVGPNGAGKSTLIKLMTGLIYPTQGAVFIDGHDVHAEHKKAMHKLGAVIEWPNFYTDLSAKRNLDILSGGHGKAYEEKVIEVTRFLNIDKILNRKAGFLSTGMKQRLGIALALLPDSKYIILDEPANGLDPAGIADIRTLIRDYKKEFNVTVLLSSHLLGEIEMICDDIIMIVDGKLKAAGSLDKLLAGHGYINIAVNRLEEAMRFFRKAFTEKTPWISSEPECSDDMIKFKIGKDADISAISNELFKAGFSISHFAREKQDLEEFFLNSTNGGR